MAVETYKDILDQMKALAEKINKHYDTVTLETVEELDTPETETQRILNELKDKGVLTEDDSIEEGWQNVSPIDKERYTEIPIEDETTRILREAGIFEDEDDDDETSKDESTVAEETEAQSDEEETTEESKSKEDDEEDRIEEELSAAQKKLPAGLQSAIAKKQGDTVEEKDDDDDSKEEVDESEDMAHLRFYLNRLNGRKQLEGV